MKAWVFADLRRRLGPSPVRQSYPVPPLDGVLRASRRRLRELSVVVKPHGIGPFNEAGGPQGTGAVNPKKGTRADRTLEKVLRADLLERWFESICFGC